MRTVTFKMEDGIVYAYFESSFGKWRYFVPWADGVATHIMNWLEYGFVPPNARICDKN